MWKGIEQIEGYKEENIVQISKITHARQEKSGCICDYYVDPAGWAIKEQCIALAKQGQVEAGNIYYVGDDNQIIPLTHIGMDHAPVLSPDKKHVAFIRASKDIIPPHCGDFADTQSRYGEQIWSVDLNNKTPHLLVNHHFSCDTPTKSKRISL